MYYIILPYCKRCGHVVKQEVFGYSCSYCKSLLFGTAVEWKKPKECTA
jgi:Zn finger protein HypA/HybF involved in hydrogenase expression